MKKNKYKINIFYLYNLAVSPSLGVADNTKETTKTPSFMLSLRKIHTEEGIPSPLAPSFSRLLRHAENTLALFFVICLTPKGIQNKDI